MKQVEGYLASDGTFFESSLDAEYHEARQVLEGVLLTDVAEQNVTKFVNLLEKNHDAVKRFIEAYITRRDAFEQEQTAFDSAVYRALDDIDDSIEHAAARLDPAIDPEDDVDQRDDTGREEDITPLQQQPFAGSEPVPDVGSSIGSEEVQHERTKPGTGMREGDARRIRGSEDMAVRVQTEPPKARGSRRRKDTR